MPSMLVLAVDDCPETVVVGGLLGGGCGGLLDGAGQFTQKVLCFWGSWKNWSLKWKPWLLCGVSPFVAAFAISVWTLITSSGWDLFAVQVEA
jgi:hypothetical protein